MQIAISDPLAHSHYALGEQLRFTAYKLAMRGDQTLSFMVASATTAGLPAAQEAKPEETAIVDEYSVPESMAIATGLTSFSGMVSDRSVRTAHGPATSGRRGIPLPDLAHPGWGFCVLGNLYLRKADTAANQAVRHATNGICGRGVDRTSGGYSRYIAFIAKWHDTRVAVTDMFANTHHACGGPY